MCSPLSGRRLEIVHPCAELRGVSYSLLSMNTPLDLRWPAAQPSGRLSRRGFLNLLAGLPLAGAIGPFNIHVRAGESRTPFATDNATITRARDVALSILKPTAQQLEHGYRLHEE